MATRAAEVNPEGKKKQRNADARLVLMDFWAQRSGRKDLESKQPEDVAGVNTT